MYEHVLTEEAERQAAAFDAIGASYEAAFGENAIQRASVNWLITKLPDGARVLDAGCGTGAPTARMLSDAGCRVVGIDISQEMLRIARQQVPEGEFLRMDMADLHLGDRTFDAVTAFFSLLMLRKQQFDSALSRLVNHLVPGGYFVLSMVEDDVDYAQIDFLGTRLHFTGFPRTVLEASLNAAGLDILELATATFAPKQGAPTETQLFYRCQRRA